MISDGGIAVNIACNLLPTDGENYIQAFSVVLNLADGQHTISMTAPPATLNSIGDWNLVKSTAWFGGVTIDGVYHGQPASGCTVANPCKGSYLNGVVTTLIQDLTNFYGKDNWVYINYQGYNLAFTYQNPGVGNVIITATNVGAQGTPGGLWGQTLSGMSNANSQLFQVSSATSVGYQYYWPWPASANTVVGSSTSTHLIK